MKDILEIQDLSYSINEKKILESISLKVREGFITGMIGGSGSGKTTLIRIILNIQLPDKGKISGTIKINGDIATNLNRRWIQPVFQDPGSYFNPNWNLQQCLEEPLTILFKNSVEEKERKISTLLNEFSISEKYLRQNIRRFSGGELQRISLIRAILCEPKILLMDEPVSGLDPLIQKDALKLIKSLKEQKNISIFLISHDIDFISSLCDYIYVIENGKIVEENYTSEILQKPSNNYTKLILHSRDLSSIRE